MDGYGIAINTGGIGGSRYSLGNVNTWDLADAAGLALELFHARRPVYVSFGNGDHEFRMWGDDVSEFGNFTHPGIRWSEWYVDVEINDERWRYRPVADLGDYQTAEDIAMRATDLDEVTRIWIGRSDGSEEFEIDPHEDSK